MISYENLKNLATEWGIGEHVVEKNYVIGWVLWGIGQDKDVGHQWIFKGGTCLKKCYLETYRFSEDLDFTVIQGGPIEIENVQPILKRILDRVHDESGINFSLREPLVKKKRFPFYAEGRIYYQGPRNAPSPASIKIDLLSSEKIVHVPVRNNIAHSYPDDLPKNAKVMCYSLEEIFAEKIRAMGERSMPRDLYDIVFLFREKLNKVKGALVKSLLIAKCKTKGVPISTFELIKNSPGLEELKSEWANMLAHQLPALPPFEEYWNALPNLFDWLENKYQLPELEPIKTKAGDEWISKPVGATLELIRKKPVEALRFAAINHLCVEMKYRKQGTYLKNYVIQPYALRQSKEDNIILYAVKVNEYRAKAFRLDWIESVNLTANPFKPKHPIEFPEFGTVYAPAIA
ncbi:MAG: nucleotidyl transferase AbiEii/AbiGii toxin family protein [Candidatus Margulisbacteria bacterium]|nr:nucleotidyl transferase AbiEii/AbiGii toxin family protein [Candidatus Margulisiibacteriota bacterium]MBU1021812.1 nucleotidyl transferase AbiEii/AbiGii toxin family protein [Candidatus Margulisiibacteriota bacterium]MBU1729612.1 nucleotidyl transferase AbiEii/AbiGii toxin family protein [Candidatus Margulisiibacteriota bacterium]